MRHDDPGEAAPRAGSGAGLPDPDCAGSVGDRRAGRGDSDRSATGPGRGIQISQGRKKGRLVIPCNHVEAGTRQSVSHVIWSDDHGKTWKLGGLAQDSTNESTIAELSNGRLMLNMRNTGKSRYRQIAISRNAGRKLLPKAPDSVLVEPVCEGNLLAFRAPGGRWGLAFSNPASAAGRINMTVRVSYDDGRTWALQRLLYGGPSAYSCLTILPDGRLSCLYEAGRLRPASDPAGNVYPLGPTRLLRSPAPFPMRRTR